MKRIIIALAIIVVAAVAALLWLLLNRPAPQAADLLPETTILLVDAPHIAKSRAEFRKTAIAALWQEPELRVLLERPLQEFWNTDNGKILAQIADAAQGEAFFAVTHVAFMPKPTAGLVLGADLKHNKLKAAATLEYLERQLASQNPGAKIESKDFHGVGYRSWEFQPGYRICRAFLNSLAVFTLGEDTMHQIITRHTAGKTGGRSLADSAGYRNAINRLPNHSELTAYLNIEQISGLLGPLLLFSPQGAATLEKLTKIQAAGSAFAFTDGGVQEVAFIAYKHAAHKPPPPTSRRSLAFTTPQTTAYCVRSMDWSKTYTDFLNSVAQAGIAHLTDAVTLFERAVRQRGVHLDYTLAALGPETALIVNWRDSAALPDAALAIQIRHPDTNRPALDAIMDSIKDAALGVERQTPWDESQHLGATIRALNLGPGKLAPAYTVAGNFLIIGPTADFVRELVTQHQSDRPKLADQPYYRKTIARLPVNAYAYNYCHLGDLYLRLAPFAQRCYGKLPPSDTVTRHLFPYVSASVADDHSDTTTAFSPTGTPVLIGAAIAGAIPAAPTPIAPKKFSGMAAPLPPPENRTAASQTPTPQ
jgi:hypothetical protein